MGILLDVFLPLSLAVIMLSLGIGLTLADFKRVIMRPLAFFTGAAGQVILLPLAAYVIARGFGLSGELAVGLMILSLCPGGVTSNILSRLGKGDVALSVTLTGVISLLSIITVPLMVAWSVGHFMGDDAPPVNITSLALAMFMITAVPVGLGLAIRHFAPRFAEKADPILYKVATALFVVIVAGALAANWDVFIENLPRLGPALIVLNIVMLGLGAALARVMSLSGREIRTIAVETGIQNATLGITVGSLLVENVSGLPPFSLPSGVYGITMYLVTIPFVLWMRRQG